MRSETSVYRFGRFELDAGRRSLVRGGRTIDVGIRYVEILIALISHPGRIFTREELISVAWGDNADVNNNSVDQAVSRLRDALGTQNDGAPYIQTRRGQGYVFIADVERGKAPRDSIALDALLMPYLAFVDGRAALETLRIARIRLAFDAFTEAVRVAPDLASAHIGLSNACALLYESTRVDATPRVEMLEQAHLHATEACQLAPSSSEACGTLAFVLSRMNDSVRAIAAARRAIDLDPDDCCHYLRFASVSCGGARLRAARQALRLCPGLAFAHWFAATVFIARQAFEPALESLRAGCALQDAQRHEAGLFHAVGLHYLHGLVLAALGRVDAATEELMREIALVDEDHVYARECLANTWYAVGALRLRHDCREDAESAFRKALTYVPTHPVSIVSLAAMSAASPEEAMPTSTITVEAVMSAMVVFAVRGQHAEAARLCCSLLGFAPPGAAGWQLPVEPMLNVMAHPEAWAPALSLLRQRSI